MTEEEQIIEEAEYSMKSDFSKAQVVQEGVNKVMQTRSQEMMGGYNNWINLPNGDVKKTYVPDTRKQFMGSVDYLRSLLAPEIGLDEGAKKTIEKFLERKKKAFEKYAVNKLVVQGKDIVQSNAKYIPEIDEETPMEFCKTRGGCIISSSIGTIRGKWNDVVFNYWNEMIEIYDELFAGLNILISNKNYFKQKSAY